jgi:coenzyme F420-0:L-glutamate ligase / coenzyme F420-1:gamma-L-glutamate ligase
MDRCLWSRCASEADPLTVGRDPESDSRRLAAWAVEGIPEIESGDDLARIIGDAIAAGSGADQLRAGDLVVVTSKIVSKAEGRFVEAVDREEAITAETVRVVASRAHANGVTRIVENRLGIVSAAAGVDASNTPEGTVLLLPLDPDASARELCVAWRMRFDVEVGVLVTDTLGRAWREGQTDVAIGAAGVHVIDDLRGSVDASGRRLDVTLPAIADEIAGLTDLVKGKAAGLPVAVVRGLSRFVTSMDAAGARSLVRTGPTDMFRLGTDEALAEGYAKGFEAGQAARAKKP